MKLIIKTLQFLLVLLAVLLLVSAAASAATVPDYSGKWTARLKRIGSDTCRRSSKLNVTLRVVMQENLENGDLTGSITGDGINMSKLEGHATSTYWNLWKRKYYKDKKYGSCTLQEGIYVPSISNYSSRKVNLNHNINCNKNGHYSYSCHYTYKGKIARDKT